MAFSYRNLGPEHVEDWQALRIEGVRDYPMGFLTTVEETASPGPDRLKEILNHGTIRGVFNGETLIGFCGYRPQQLERTRHRAEIGPFFVSGRYHGSGAAHTLMQGLIKEARRAGIEQLELFVDTENHRAIRFYEAHGFKGVATHPDGVRINGTSRDDHFYILRLGH